MKKTETSKVIYQLDVNNLSFNKKIKESTALVVALEKALQRVKAIKL